jgi:hypothetical protein
MVYPLIFVFSGFHELHTVLNAFKISCFLLYWNSTYFAGFPQSFNSAAVILDLFYSLELPPPPPQKYYNSSVALN